MKTSVVLLTLSSALLLAGCQTKPQANACDGWERLTPSAQTRSFIIAYDRPFAEQIGSHNGFGSSRGCWKP